jgi:hypothetical protein
MKKLFFLGLFMPLIALSQKPTVISFNRFFPKNDKVMEFEKALQMHGAKYHKGDWKWRVFTIESGPESGGYHVIEGPATWDQIDNRGTLGKEHTEDFLKNVLPLTTEKNYAGFVVYREDLSSAKLMDTASKIAISHIYPKPGMIPAMEATIKGLKKVWDDAKQNIVVYESNTSGPAQYAIITRYKQGLKEKELDFRKPLKERYNAVNGEGSFDKYMSSVAEQLDHQWSELLIYSPELSAK